MSADLTEVAYPKAVIVIRALPYIHLLEGRLTVEENRLNSPLKDNFTPRPTTIRLSKLKDEIFHTQRHVNYFENHGFSVDLIQTEIPFITWMTLDLSTSNIPVLLTPYRPKP